MTKEEIIIKHLDGRYGELSAEIKYLKVVQFPNATVELMMAEFAEQETLSLRSRIEKLEGALKELVDLKEMKDSNVTHDVKRLKEFADYMRRKPLAWQAARELIYPEALKH